MSSVCDRDLMGLAKMGLASQTKATMMYLFPWLDVTGNQPVWLVVMWPVTSMHFTFTRFVRNCGIWEDSTFVVTVDVEGEEGDGLVLRTFLRTSLSWPLAVDIDLGRYFRIRELVRPGRVAKKELSMAIVQMWMTGHHAQRRIHVARSTLVRRLYTLFTRGGGVEGVIGGVDMFCMLTKYILERLLRLPMIVGAVGCSRTVCSGLNQHVYPALAKTPTERRER